MICIIFIIELNVMINNYSSRLFVYPVDNCILVHLRLYNYTLSIEFNMQLHEHLFMHLFQYWLLFVIHVVIVYKLTFIYFPMLRIANRAYH